MTPRPPLLVKYIFHYYGSVIYETIYRTRSLWWKARERLPPTISAPIDKERK
jgi:ABC-type arginine/histidine transport system permease subunit